MISEAPLKSAKASKEEFDLISNRLALALAKRESIIKSWTASSSRPTPPPKTQEELDAEDAILFKNEPAYLGVGAPIPSHFLVSEAERNNKSLRAKFFPTKGLKASKARDAEEKAASAKRGLKEESSDEEEGRSGLGRAKKLKTKVSPSEPIKKIAKDKAPEDTEDEEKGQSGLGKLKKLKTKGYTPEPVKKPVESLAPEKPTARHSELPDLEKQNSNVENGSIKAERNSSEDSTRPIGRTQRDTQRMEKSVVKSAQALRKQRKREKRKLAKLNAKGTGALVSNQ
jgi:hypothetical protein